MQAMYQTKWNDGNPFREGQRVFFKTRQGWPPFKVVKVEGDQVFIASRNPKDPPVIDYHWTEFVKA